MRVRVKLTPKGPVLINTIFKYDTAVPVIQNRKIVKRDVKLCCVMREIIFDSSLKIIDWTLLVLIND